VLRSGVARFDAYDAVHQSSVAYIARTHAQPLITQYVYARSAGLFSPRLEYVYIG